MSKPRALTATVQVWGPRSRSGPPARTPPRPGPARAGRPRPVCGEWTRSGPRVRESRPRRRPANSGRARSQPVKSPARPGSTAGAVEVAAATMAVAVADPTSSSALLQTRFGATSGPPWRRWWPRTRCRRADLLGDGVRGRRARGSIRDPRVGSGRGGLTRGRRTGRGREEASRSDVDPRGGLPYRSSGGGPSQT